LSDRTFLAGAQDIATAMILPVVVLYVVAETLADRGHPQWHASTDVVLDVFLVLGIVGRWPPGSRGVKAAVKLAFVAVLLVRLATAGGL
jgi:hypothetical protein